MPDLRWQSRQQTITPPPLPLPPLHNRMGHHHNQHRRRHHNHPN